MLTAIAFIFVLGVLIFFHELGHFLMAKKVGITVEKFSLGFPPNIFKKKVGETTYCIGLIPLGGYVKMAGENPDEELTGAEGEFMSKTVLQRVAVVFAGPFMNYILTIIILTGLFFFRGHPVSDPDRIIVGNVSEDSPALSAGLQADDRIVAFNGEKVTSMEALRSLMADKVSVPINLTWVSGEDTITREIITKPSEVMLMDGTVDTVGIIGFYEKSWVADRYNPLVAIKQGFYTTHYWVYETGKVVVSLVTGKFSMKMIGGPVFIAKASGEAARQGISYLFSLMALLSVNLAVLNILPIPILDGGHLVFLACEKIKGAPLSIKTRAIAQQVGLLILLFIIIMVTYNDIMRLF
ncbi:MAG: RIP metalloprotease RseP [candidate division Zixibacteria bacterium]|nr:RIP metalloprotease RseP [candidate division Zixibacteria bacterium]